MDVTRIVVGGFVLGLCACGPAVILPDDGETSSGANDGSTTTTSTSTGNASASTTSPGTTDSPGTSAPGTTADPSDPSNPLPTTTGPVPETDSDDTSTTTPTTAGEDGGTPGGAGPDGAPDDPGDVMLPEADAIAAAVYSNGELIDLRVQLATAPFGVEATYDISWCLGTDTGTGSCATHADNIEAHLLIALTDSGVESDPFEISPCLYGAFETETNTVRMLVPTELLLGHDDFEWIMTVSYGGSFGNNEWLPDEGALDVTVVDEFPPFSGETLCD